jgi:hypothetical protein
MKKEAEMKKRKIRTILKIDTKAKTGKLPDVNSLTTAFKRSSAFLPAESSIHFSV